MDLHFENLGHDRFQELCTSLISKEFPNIQSFPVGQPDGGRDTITYTIDAVKKDFNVYQVKHIREPYLVSDVFTWLKDKISDELPKIERLIKRGAKAYYFLCNLKGTAHLDVGSKDKINAYLQANINIPAICWWSDDLSRMIEKDPLFLWSFPEILNGQTILNSLLFSYISENKEKRESTFNAYLADQYRMDNEVKFRQIDLQNKLFNLFTDVPIRAKKFNDKNKKIRQTLGYMEWYGRSTKIDEDGFMYFDRSEQIGAAKFLLHPKVQDGLNRILLEGGPGQGKSTISQYICQVHRARLLNKQIDIEQLPEHVLSSPVRLPLKVDLRHVAAWVDSKNPYSSRLNDEYFNSIWKNSLESFLIGHIIYHSQVDTFNVMDLLSVLKQSSVLLVFDGFDEIADLKIRQEVIEFINKGVNRLAENSKSLQVLITSRPAAFSDAIGFSIDTYPHFELTDITKTITKEYLEKWIKASKLDGREASELRRQVDEKIQLPHLKDLAKSPMQLAIFISLLRTRGESLPNKRTAMYDSYIELFFNREAEKSSFIRDNRDLIIDIHEYLAWVLHSEAETLKNSGSIYLDDLVNRLRTYLLKEGHNADIADKLFHVMEERVCALVSRVQGTYEFEVQPLREYFCAKYLYNTSPYSPAGSEKMGTKPDRFDAIARNSYWHNVARFFAGCFDKGELPMLIQKLKELQEDDTLKVTNYPRLLTAQILSDWVFTQYPNLLKSVVNIIIDGINIGNIINQQEKYSSHEPIILPTQCGRAEIVEEAFEQLKKFPPNDYSLELIGLIKSNPSEILEKWSVHLEFVTEGYMTKWLYYAYELQIIHKIEKITLEQIIQAGNRSDKVSRLQILIKGNRLDVIEDNISLKQLVFESLLKGRIFFFSKKDSPHSLQFLAGILSPYLFTNLHSSQISNLTFEGLLIGRLRHQYLEQKNLGSYKDFPVQDEIDQLIKRVLDAITPILTSEVSEWKTSITLWDTLVESLMHIVPEKWILKIVATIAAGIKSKHETFDKFDDLEDDTASLCKRVRCARMKSGNISYWEKCLRERKDTSFVLLALFTWGTPKTISTLTELIDDAIKDLSEEQLIILNNHLGSITVLSAFNKSQVQDVVPYFESVDTPMNIKMLLSNRIPEDVRLEYVYKNIKNAKGLFEADISEIKLNYIVEAFLKNPKKSYLSEIKLIYSTLSRYRYRPYYRQYREYEIPLSIANSIMNESILYPRIIASIAEQSCRRNANEKMIPVGKIAKDGAWFD